MKKAHIVLIGIFTSVVLVMVGCEISKIAGVGSKDAPRSNIVGYTSGSAVVSLEDAKRLTHVNYAFARLDEQGELYFTDPDAPQHLERLVQLKSKVPYLNVLVSIGGWGGDYFSDAALTDSSRKTFAVKIGALLKEHSLDGVDIDWEYPGQPGPGIGYREEDKVNFTKMLKTIRDHLDELGKDRGRKFPGYILTIAASDSERYLAHTEMDTVHHFVDHINVMSYDFYTAGSETTGHHSGLGKSLASEHEHRNARAGIERFLAAGVPPEKIVLGVAFYGRSWAGVDKENNGLYQEYDAFSGALGYAHIENLMNQDGYERHWDEEAKAPYLWNPDSSIFISYEDPESLIYKSTYVIDNELGGIMYWEHRHDKQGALLDVLYHMLK